MKVYKPVSDREVARRLSVATINSAYYYLPIIHEIFGIGLVICERTDVPQGEWKHLGGDEWLCPNCGHVVWTEGSWEHPLERGKDYCEHCGAHMKGADDEKRL